MRGRATIFAILSFAGAPAALAGGVPDELIAKHAIANDVPESLVRRVITIESRGNPSVVSKGNYGLMQIRLGTARALGYEGGAQGLLDADTNMKYAVKYLAGAYRAAGCNPDRAIAYYQRGYAYAGKMNCQSQSSFVVAHAEAKPAKMPAGVPPREPIAARSLARADKHTGADTLKPKVVQTLPVAGRGASHAAQSAGGTGRLNTVPTESKPDTFADRMMATASRVTTDARGAAGPEEISVPPSKRQAAPEAKLAPGVKGKPAPDAKLAPDVKPAQEPKPSTEVKLAPEAKPVHETKLAPEAMPVQVAKVAAETKPVPDAKPARHSSRRHAFSKKRRQLEKTEEPAVPLISFLKKLVLPDPKPAERKRRRHEQQAQR